MQKSIVYIYYHSQNKKQEPLLIDSAGTAEKFSSYINFLTDVWDFIHDQIPHYSLILIA